MIAITSRRLIDGTGRAPLEPGVLLIEDEYITAVGTPPEVPIPDEAQVIDVGGQTLLPGLIDMHAHISLPPQLREPDAVRAFWITANLRRYLKSGCTTIRVVGEFNFVDIECRRAVDAGVIAGPRLLVAGNPLHSGHGLPLPVNGVDATRKAVRQNLKAGADLTKMFVTASMLARNEAPTACHYSKAEIEVAVEETHRAGKRVAAHAHGGIGLQYCLEAGVDTIEHGVFMEDQDIELFLKRGAWLVATNSVLYHPEGFERTRFSDPELKERILEARETTAERFHRAYQAGIKHTVGTDNMIGHLAYEAKLLVDFGVDPLQAVAAATGQAAEACGVADRWGTLKPGMYADTISVDGNPLEDITALYNVGLIMKGGQRYDTISEL
ncbi:MAG: amidohydrolase family protein [Ardenticatenaceae bacterium]|nr:amidohydrolase family protein [Ardenticatenaceae bacterium]HBY95909.1 hypothetical protein [Chloroflexota bacterium]